MYVGYHPTHDDDFSFFQSLSIMSNVYTYIYVCVAPSLRSTFVGPSLMQFKGLWSQNGRNSDFMVVGPIKRAYFSSGKRLDLQIGL